MALATVGATVSLTTSASAAAVPGTSVVYTTDEDFEKGLLVNVNHDAPNNNQLQLNRTTGTFPFIWVALSQRCTIAKVNTDTGAILGEYRTLSDGTPCSESSRTTVGLDGSVWVGHRFAPRVTHVGLVELNECVDRNNNGTIETSNGYGDVKAWPGVGAPVAAAQDECILHHLGYAGGDSRHMSIDADGNLWVGDRDGGSIFRKFDGDTGALLAGPLDFACGGYGGLIDGNGVIWSANSTGSLLRYDTTQPIGATNPRCIGVPNYGVAIDSQGNVWVSTAGQGLVRKFLPDGTLAGTFAQGVPVAQGLAIDGNDHVWISSSLNCSANCTVSHLRNDGSFVGLVPTPTGSGSTGVSVDSAGKVWTANRNSHTAVRIDPAAGPLVSGTPLGQVDLTVGFPAGPGGRPLPFPYNYSDMTGAQLLNSTAPQGSWTVVQDGGAAGTNWGKVTWNSEPEGSVPAGTSIVVEARAADTEAGLGAQPYTPVSNGVSFNVVGQFIQVRATLKANAQGDSPVLSDIKIETANKPPVFDVPPTPVCGSTLAVNTGSTATFGVQASDPNADQTVTLTGSGIPAGARMTPALPASGNPVTSKFSWAPTPADEGTHSMTFTATDPFGAQVTCTVGVRVVALVMTGRAYVAQAKASVPLLGVTLNTPAINDTGEVATKTPVDRQVGIDATAPPVAAKLLKSSVVAAIGSSEARASAAEVTISALGVPTIKATALEAVSRTTCAGSTGIGRVATLSIGGNAVAVPADPAPNTTISVLGITVVFNEQVAKPGELTVNAVHLKSPTLDIVLASARSDIHNCL